MKNFNIAQSNITQINNLINNFKSPIEIFNYVFLEKNNLLNFDYLDGSLKSQAKWEVTFEILSQDLSSLLLEMSGYLYQKLKYLANKNEILKINKEKKLITKIFKGQLLTQIEKNTLQVIMILLNKNNTYIIHPHNRFRGVNILFQPETMHYLLSII
jgi:hypothetical protein